MERIILASGSPRRKKILKDAGLEFEVCPSGYEETLDNNIFDYKKIETLARNKAKDIADKTKENAIIIGADTVVVYKDKILTKPHDRDDAFNMLHNLSDAEHHVVTGICIINKYTNQTITDHVTTTVRFEKLSDEMINYYIDNYKPFDKAGAYGIQELPEGFVHSVNGSLENVIGLCSKKVLEMINESKK